jgi:anti-sigma B factor antagonist
MERRHINDVVVITTDRRFDATSAPKLKELVMETNSPEGMKLVIDVSNTYFIDSSASGALVASWRFVKRNNGEMKIAGPSQHLKSLFRLVRLSQVVDMYESVEAAVAAFRGNMKGAHLPGCSS